MAVTGHTGASVLPNNMSTLLPNKSVLALAVAGFERSPGHRKIDDKVAHVAILVMPIFRPAKLVINNIPYSRLFLRGFYFYGLLATAQI